MELLRQTIRTLFFLQKPETVIRGLADEGKHYDADLRNEFASYVPIWMTLATYGLKIR